MIVFHTTNRSGQIDFQEFYYKLSPPLEGRRLEAIDTVFTLLDKNSDGVLQAEDIIGEVYGHERFSILNKVDSFC